MKTVIRLINYLLLTLPIFILAKNEASIVYQIIDVKNYKGQKFIYSSKTFIERANTNTGAVLAAFNLKEGKMVGKPVLDLQQMSDSYNNGEWFDYTISGTIDKNADFLAIGFYFSGKGKFYFNNIDLSIKNGKTSASVYHSDFNNGSLGNWYFSEQNLPTKISISPDKKYQGNSSFLIDNSSVSQEYILGDNPSKGKYEDINGVKLYYESYGSGPDLILLHGNNGSIFSFNKQVEELAKHFHVIAVDTRCQGKSSCNEENLTYELFAKDTDILMEKLKIEKVYILGWSDGANTGLIMAEKYPSKVSKLAVMSAILYNNDDSVDKKINNLLKIRMADFKKQNIGKDNIDYKLTNLLITEPHLTINDLKKITIPVLVMTGENDFIKLSHTELIAKNINHSILKIFKNSGHEAPKEIPQEFNNTVIEFFKDNYPK
ncbi:alpha/beta fold hydrolase [Chryseobacterium taichungense]|uniref:alpha/beta fold hydrolase n=1 Tax=Chryseobacterium taichungense TaxID=295069 RepID=UPI0028B04E7F|nr:alpha/beta hydrolase [Chryseobacterium taichungense]